MRKLIFAINTTLDGCVDHTKQSVDDEIHTFFADLTKEADIQIFGRKTYELMVPYWPEAANDPTSTPTELEFAEAFNSTEKVVFSRTLETVDDENTRIAQDDLHDEVQSLKQEDGRNILVGGVEIASQLVELGLIDEYLFVVSPAIAGEGRRLFDNISLTERPQLKLVDSKFFASGTVALRYKVTGKEL